MYWMRMVLGLCFVLMAFNDVRSSQVGDSDQIVLDEKMVRQWTKEFTALLFAEVNPRQTMQKNVFFGELTKAEAKLFPRRKWLNPLGKKVPTNLQTRYFWLRFERAYLELFFSLGTKEYSNSFSEIAFDDNDFTTIENKDYADILTSVLKKNRIMKNEFATFFEEASPGEITKTEVARFEKVYSQVRDEIRSRIHVATFESNAKKISKLWEIEQIQADKRYYLATNPLIGRFVVGLRDGRVQIVYIPNSDD